MLIRKVSTFSHATYSYTIPLNSIMIIEHKILNYKGRIVFEKLIVGNFRRMLKTFNETEACFMYIQEGFFQFRTPEKIIQVNTGDGLLAKCSDYYFEREKIHHQNTYRIQGIGVYLYPTIIKELFDFDMSISDFETNYDVTKVNIQELMKNFINGIEFLLDNPSISNDSMIKIKLKEFLLLLSKTESAPTLFDFISSLFKPYEYNFKKIIKHNLYSNLKINELAVLCGMSISTFQRTFYKMFNQTPSQYILKQRMIKAKEMLGNKNIRISEIAYDCGYQSNSTFNRLFKNYFGISPSKFRLNKIDC